MSCIFYMEIVNISDGKFRLVGRRQASRQVVSLGGHNGLARALYWSHIGPYSSIVVSYRAQRDHSPLARPLMLRPEKSICSMHSKGFQGPQEAPRASRRLQGLPGGSRVSGNFRGSRGSGNPGGAQRASTPRKQN